MDYPRQPSSVREADHVQQLADLRHELEEGEGELTPELEQRLDALEASVQERLRYLARVRDRWQAEADRWGFWTERVGNRAEAARRRVLGLDNYMARLMVAAGIKQVDTFQTEEGALIEAQALLLRVLAGPLPEETRNALHQALRLIGGEDDLPLTVILRQNPGRTIVPLDVVSQLPPACLIEQAPRVNLSAVRTMLEAGVRMPPGVCIEKGYRVVIR